MQKSAKDIPAGGIYYQSFLLESEKTKNLSFRSLPSNAKIEIIQEFLDVEEIQYVSIQ